MKNDFSNQLFIKYFSLKNRNIKIQLKNGDTIEGYFQGFYRDEDNGTKIIKWDFIEAEYTKSLNFHSGKTIPTSDIYSIYFFSDNSFLSNE